MAGSIIYLAIVLGISIAVVVSSDDLGYIEPGKPFSLTCKTDIEIKWLRPDGVEVVADDRHVMNNTEGTLNITVVGEHDVGKFQCVKKDDVTIVIDTAEIKTSPYVPRMTKSVNHVVGETAKLECVAWGTDQTDGIHPMVFTWQRSKSKDGRAYEELNNGTGSVLIRDVEDNRVNHRTQLLIISNLTYEDYQYYTCSVNNGLGAGANSTTNLRVKDKLAPLWPFIGICIEILVLIIIIVIYEKRKSKRTDDEDGKEKSNLQSNTNAHKGEENVRFRK